MRIINYTDGDAKWYFDDIPVHPYATYAYSVKYISTAPAKLFIRYTQNSGSYLYNEVAQLSPTATWTTANIHFTIPENIASLTIFHQMATPGTLMIDEASLLPFADFSGSTFDFGMVSFSFDDGWVSQLIDAVPVLNSHNIK